MLSDLYFIQGVFWQYRECLGLDTMPVEGVVAVIRSGLCRIMYAGVIERDLHHLLGGYCGEMQDECGHANLRDVILACDQLRFVKQYDGCDDLIMYEFARQEDGTWAGEYSGEKTGRGYSRCILTPVSLSFFAPRPEDLVPHALEPK